MDEAGNRSGSDSAASPGRHAALWQEIGSSFNTAQRAQNRPDQAEETWHKATLDFGTAEDLYKTTDNSTHPFTASEIAMSGVISGVERNEYEAIDKGPSSALAANDNAPALPDSFLHPFTSEQQSKLRALGADFANYESTINASRPPADSVSELPNNFGNGSLLADVQSLLIETPSQVQHDIGRDLSQTGSAGVDQTGNLNDCWFEAPLASLAATPQGQKDIAGMITQNKDHSYTVKFPGDPTEPVNVSQADLKNFSLQNTAQWANILEAANLKLNPYQAINGGTDKTDMAALHMLTGQTANEYYLTDTDRALAKGGSVSEESPHGTTLPEWIQKALAAGDPVQAAVGSDDTPLVGEHSYSVLSWQNNLVTLRNPFGSTAADGKQKPEIGQTIDGVTNLGGGEVQMSSRTFMNDITVVEMGRMGSN
jgi:hypothetical protein